MANHSIKVELDDDQEAVMVANAKGEGMTVAAYLRDTLMREVDTKVKIAADKKWQRLSLADKLRKVK